MKHSLAYQPEHEGFWCTFNTLIMSRIAYKNHNVFENVLSRCMSIVWSNCLHWFEKIVKVGGKVWTQKVLNMWSLIVHLKGFTNRSLSLEDITNLLVSNGVKWGPKVVNGSHSWHQDFLLSILIVRQTEVHILKFFYKEHVQISLLI